MPAPRLAETPVQEYDPEMFDTLPLFRESKEALHANRGRLCPLGGVIVEHGLTERLAVSLLHKHFPLREDEIIIRSFDMTNRMVTMQPSSEKRAGAIPYLWRATREADGSFVYHPLEFVREEDAKELCDFSLGDHLDFLTDMAEALAKSDLLDVFGVATPNIMKLAQNDYELLIETTDSAQRVLTVTPQRGPVPDENELTETLWTFSAAHDEKTRTTKCIGTHCTGHCKQHCDMHCRQHCRRHTNP